MSCTSFYLYSDPADEQGLTEMEVNAFDVKDCISVTGVDSDFMIETCVFVYNGKLNIRYEVDFWPSELI